MLWNCIIEYSQREIYPVATYLCRVQDIYLQGICKSDVNNFEYVLDNRNVCSNQGSTPCY